MRFQKSGDSYIVHVKRSEWPGGHSRMPAEFPIGSVSRSRGIDVWPNASGAYGPRGEKIARAWEEKARKILYHTVTSGRILAGVKSARREGRKEGSFIVKFSNGTQTAFHEMKEATDFTERKLLRMPIGSQAKFFRRGVGGRSTWTDGRPLEGIPWTAPFHVMETYEHDGKKRVGMSSGVKKDPRRRQDPSHASASRAHLSRSRLSLAQHEKAVRTELAKMGAKSSLRSKDDRRMVLESHRKGRSPRFVANALVVHALKRGRPRR